MGLTRITAQQISDIDYKQAVRAVSVSTVTLSGGTPVVVDGVTLAAGNRVLVVGQSTSSQNGLYYVSTLGTGSNGTWTRTTDGNETGEIEAGMIIMVTEGTTYADTQWKLTTNDPIIIGTTGLTFTQNYSASSISSGTSNVAVSSSANVSVAVAGNNVAVFATTGEYVTGLISATGNVTGNYILGNGAFLSGVITSVANINNGTSNVTVVSSGGNITVGVGGTGNVAVFASTGANITGTLNATGNVAGSYFIGDGSLLTNLPSQAGNAITNGTSNVAITTPAGNVTVGVNGTANTVVISPGSIFVNGVFATPKTITSNVQIAADSSAMVISPLTIGNGYSMTIPTSSTVYVWIPS